MVRFFRLVLFFLLPIASLSAQNNPAQQSFSGDSSTSNPQPSPSARQITLDVQVTDGSGAPVRGLQPQDFTLQDGQKPQSIVSFHAFEGAPAAGADAPAELVLVIDAVNAPYQILTTERNEVTKFLLQNGGKLALPVELVFFAAAGTKLQDRFSRDGNALASLYDQSASGLVPNNLSATERFDLSIKTLGSLAAHESKRPGRKLMVWISPGWPLLSGGNLQLTPKDFQWLFDSTVVLTGALHDARITLYDVDPLGVMNSGGTRLTYYQEFLKPATAPRKMQPGYLSLQVFAVQSGGRVFNSTNDLTKAIADCAADADSFYVLSFNTPPAETPNQYHALGVSVDKPANTVRTRSGYYTSPGIR
ncbi:MAG: VWA domain-containing protein [Candidatus Sulfotelmatobacter sp.]